MSIDAFLSRYLEASNPTASPKWEEEEVKSYWLMENPYQIIALVLSYLLFVAILGPRLMRDRKPFSLKHFMMVYNVFQVAYNIWFIWMFFREKDAIKYFMDESCHPRIPSRSRYLRSFAIKLTWFWMISKISDLLDTVFFVLRKKQSQVTFLHLYHHTHMVVMTWVFLKYVRGEQGIMIGLINSSVHVVMYSYYFLTALGPHVQKYLWWKKYITRLQLFFLLTAYFIALLRSCTVPPIQAAYNLYAAMQGVVFTILFLNFYFKSYTAPRKNLPSIPDNNLVKKQRIRHRAAGF